eukprot:5228988-Karenia_brevis.AAC.1
MRIEAPPAAPVPAPPANVGGKGKGKGGKAGRDYTVVESTPIHIAKALSLVHTGFGRTLVWGAMDALTL